MNKILAIDPGTLCGFALKDGSNIISGTWDLSIARDESRGMRLVRLRNKLNEIGKVDLLVFEISKNYMSAIGAEVAGEIRGVLTMWAHDNSVEYKGIHYSIIKKHATGKGNANKKMMIEAASKLFTKNITDDNEADALCLLSFILNELS